MKSYDTLKSILQEMVTVYDKLISVGKEKQAALIKGDQEELLAIFPKESAFVKEISVLEDKRQAETITYSSMTDLIADQTSLEEKEELRSYQTELKAKLAELDQQHQINQKLVETSLSYVNSMLDLFVQKREQSNTYTAKNSLQGNEHTQARSFFDAKV